MHFSSLLSKNLKKLLGNRLIVCLMISVIVMLAITTIQAIGLLEPLELRAYDQMLLFRADTAIDDRITIIGETEADIRRFGHPLPDQVLSNALTVSEQAGARVIGVDKYRDVSVPPGTEALSALLSRYENIIWIFFSGNPEAETIAPPPALADKPEQIGFSNIVQDQDDVLRRGLLFINADNNNYYAFPLLIALHYLAPENISAETDANGLLSFNGLTLPPLDSDFAAYQHTDVGGYQIMLNYPGLPNSYRFYSLTDLIDGKVPKADLADKIVLLGGTAPSLHDYRMLPDGIRRYGIELHAFFISQILDAAHKHKPAIAAWSIQQENLWLYFWCLIGASIGLRRGGFIWLLLLIGLNLSLLGLTDIWFFTHGWWLPLIAPLFSWGLALALSMMVFASRERAERGQLMQLFASHVSKEVAGRIWRDRELFFSEGGVRPDTLTATVLFTDLSNFTTIAENMEPLVLIKWLNEYMEVMSTCVIEHGGVINKYIGDAIMAVFGVPIKSDSPEAISQDAKNAVQCAIKFNEKLRELNTHWQNQGLPVVTMRTGIYTGSLVAGSFGGSLRKEYTVIGDTVNTAARLESYDKNIAAPTLANPCRVLIGESTKDLVAKLFATEMVGECQLKGKNKFLKIYRVIFASN